MSESIENIVECVAHLIENSSEWKSLQKTKDEEDEIELNRKLTEPSIADDCCRVIEVDELDFS